MSPTESRVPAIRYWSYRISWMLVVCQFILPVIIAGTLAASWLNGMDFSIWESGPTNLSTMAPSVALFVATATAIAFGVFMIPLYCLQQMFKCWGKGEILTRVAAKALKRTGLWLALGTIVVSALLPAFALAFSAWLMVDIPIGFSFELDGLLVSGIVYVMGMVLDEAARVAEDAELTI